jgi:hypothetical protein
LVPLPHFYWSSSKHFHDLIGSLTSFLLALLQVFT